MALFGKKQDSDLQSCISMVESVIQSLGHDPDDSRVETDSPMPAWCVHKGTASVTISVLPADDGGVAADTERNQIQVLAPVLELDARVDRPRLYQHLLELNAGAVKGAAFALRGEQVVLVSERSTVDLDLSEVRDLVKRVEEYADRYDESLSAQFGGRIPGRGGAQG